MPLLRGVFQPFPRQYRADLGDGQPVERVRGQVGFIAVDVKGHHAVPVGVGDRAPGLDGCQAGVFLVVQLGQLAVAPLVLAQVFLAAHHLRLQLAGDGLQVAGGLAGDQVLELDRLAVDLLVQLLELGIDDIGQQLLVVVLDLLAGGLQVVEQALGIAGGVQVGHGGVRRHQGIFRHDVFHPGRGFRHGHRLIANEHAVHRLALVGVGHHDDRLLRAGKQPGPEDQEGDDKQGQQEQEEPAGHSPFAHSSRPDRS